MTASRHTRFFFWNDLHIRAPALMPTHRTYPGANEKANWAVECALGGEGIEPPDFVASGGDWIQGEIPDFGVDFNYLREHILDRLPMPVLPCVGNHENRQGEGVPERNAAYDAFWGGNRHNYIYTCGGLAFIVVDTSGAQRVGDEVTDARHRFVEQAFVEVTGQPVIVITHVPLIPFRDLEPYRASFGFSTWKVLDEGLLEIVESHADTVIAVLCGHIHLTGARERNGIRHIMPGGIGGYPADFAAVDVYADHIDVEMVSAPRHLLDRGGNIHGRERHGIDYTDGAHPDPESYVRGNPEERRLRIELAGKKRPAAGAAPTPTILPACSP